MASNGAAGHPSQKPVARAIEKVLNLGLLASSAGVLAIAWQLQPDPSGMGTHRQLGLGACTFYSLTGWPCPTCGMTTTFAYAMHGQWGAAFLTQPFGFLLFLCTVAVAGVSAVEALRPTRRWTRFWGWLAPREGWVAGALMLGMMGGWAYKLLLAAVARMPAGP